MGTGKTGPSKAMEGVVVEVAAAVRDLTVSGKGAMFLGGRGG